MAQMREMMYEGKAKQVFATDDPTLAVIHYKDDATAFNGLKKGTIVGKGVINNLVSNHLMKLLAQHGSRATWSSSSMSATRSCAGCRSCRSR